MGSNPIPGTVYLSKHLDTETMEMLNVTEEKVTQRSFTIQTKEGVVHYKEWEDEKGKVIDTQLVSKDGYDMSDEYDLIEEIQEFVDEHLKNQ